MIIRVPMSVIIVMVFAAMFLGIGFFVDAGREWRSLVMVIRLLGVGFGLVMLVMLLDLAVHRGAERRRELGAASVYAPAGI